MGIARSSCALSETVAVAEGVIAMLEVCYNGLLFFNSCHP